LLQISPWQYKNDHYWTNRKLFQKPNSGDENLDEANAATVILKELWKRLRETHKLRVVK